MRFAKPRHIFISAAMITLTLVSGGTTLHLAAKPTLTKRQERLFSLALEVWAMSTGITVEAMSSASKNTDEHQ